MRCLQVINKSLNMVESGDTGYNIQFVSFVFAKYYSI